MSSKKKINTPIAVAFSKLDAVDSLLGPQMQVKAEPRLDSRFDLLDAEAVDGEMKSLLSEWGALSLLQQVETDFSNHAFFGLSSLGSIPEENGKVKRLLPKRVVDPFLWLLYKNNLIKASD